MDPKVEQLGFELPRQAWPPHDRFPHNFGGPTVGERLSRDLQDSRHPLVVTGYGGIEELLGLLASWEHRGAAGAAPMSARLLIGVEPRGPQRPLIYGRSPALHQEITDFWLSQGVSILQSRNLLSAISLIERGAIEIRSSGTARVHAKIYVSDRAATLGSSNFTRPGLRTNIEGNVRFAAEVEPERFDETTQLAERIWEQGRDYREAFLNLLRTLLQKVTWQEAMARACSEVLEGDRDKMLKAPRGTLWPSQEQGISQALWVLENVGSVLIADTTGSGKTKTGAHLIAALLERNWATGRRRGKLPVLICPPALEQHWRDELSRAGESVSVFSHGILGRDDGRRIKELQAAIQGSDLLVVDEAHNFLNHLSNRTRALLENTANHVILLTATPINRGPSDLLSIVDLLGADNFDDDVLRVVARLSKMRRTAKPQPFTSPEKERVREALQGFVVRRTKRDLNALVAQQPERFLNALGEPCRFPEHKSIVFSRNDPSTDRSRAGAIREKAKNLRGLANLRRPIRMPAAQQFEGRTEEQYLRMRLGGARALAAYQVRSRLRSSRIALLEHIIGTAAACEHFGLSIEKTAKSGDLISTLAAIRGKPPKIQLEVDVPEWLRDPAAHAVAVEEEIATYEDIRDQVERMSDHREVANAQYLLQLAESHERMLAFDSHPISLVALRERLERMGGVPQLATGELTMSQRLAFSQRFGLTAESEPLIGLCSDALAEGLNLQGASAVVHLDLPTVVRVLEQRIGRIDRMDSPHDRIEVHWPDEPIEYQLRSDERLFLRLREVEDLIGSNVPIPEDFADYQSDEGDSVKVQELIAAVERDESESDPQVSLSDAFRTVRDLVSGPGALISPAVYDQIRGSTTQLVSSVSVVRSETAWAFLAIEAIRGGVPRWVLVDDLSDEQVRIEGQLGRVALTMAERLGRGAEDQPFDDQASALLERALQEARVHQHALLPHRKRRALDEMKAVLKLSRADREDRARTKMVEGILSLLDRPDVDLNRLADWWLRLVQPEWYSHMKRPRVRRPVQLKHLRKELRAAPMSSERLETIRDLDLRVVPLDRRVVAAVVGVASR